MKDDDMKMKCLFVVMSAALVLTACGGGNNATSTPGSTPVNTAQIPNTATAAGYSLTLFATAPSAKAKPDSIVQYNNTVFIGYQMAGDVKDGSVPGLTNTVVQYDLNGNVLKSYTVPGHVDGLMARTNPTTLWALSNEDSNPELTLITLAPGPPPPY